jgi:hypothetical protein
MPEPLIDEIDMYRRIKAWRKMGVRRDIQVARAIVKYVEAALKDKEGEV